VVATHLRCGSRTLPQRPCAHADPTTPAGEDGFSGRLLPHPPTAFPLWQEGRLQRSNYRGLLRVHVPFGLRTCTLVSPRTTPEASAGRSLASTAPVATGRTDNSPDGTCTRWPLRPRRSLRSLKLSSRQPPFVPHCHPLRPLPGEANLLPPDLQGSWVLWGPVSRGSRPGLFKFRSFGANAT
jgi:hypothetical protein